MGVILTYYLSGLVFYFKLLYGYHESIRIIIIMKCFGVGYDCFWGCNLPLNCAYDYGFRPEYSMWPL